MTWDPNQQPMQPFRPGMPPPARPKPQLGGMSPWLWLLAGGGLMLMLCLGGGVVVAVMGLGANIMEEEVSDQLRDNPKLREHIGEIQSFEVNTAGSMLEPDGDTFRYRVQGSTGSGELTVRHITGKDSKEVVEDARLRLSDGTQVQIVP